MARPTTKEDLIKAANTQFDKMLKLIEALPGAEENIEFCFPEEFIKKQKEAHWKRDLNLRDVLIHLYEWHQLLIKWVEINQKGEPASFLPEPYNWKTYGEMNRDFWEKHQSTPYFDAKKMLLESHKKVIELIDRFSNEELFEKKHFAWTGTTSLGSYCVSATSSHYDWAIKKLKQHAKTASIE